MASQYKYVYVWGSCFNQGSYPHLNNFLLNLSTMEDISLYQLEDGGAGGLAPHPNILGGGPCPPNNYPATDLQKSMFPKFSHYSAFYWSNVTLWHFISLSLSWQPTAPVYMYISTYVATCILCTHEIPLVQKIMWNMYWTMPRYTVYRPNFLTCNLPHNARYKLTHDPIPWVGVHKECQ